MISKIAGGKLKIATEDDLKIYYENNKEQFKIANTITVVAYVSKNKKLLNQLKKNPMLQSKDILVQNITMKQNELNPQTKYILNSTAPKQFSAIFAQNKNYNMFYVKEKKILTIYFLQMLKIKYFK